MHGRMHVGTHNWSTLPRSRQPQDPRKERRRKGPAVRQGDYASRGPAPPPARHASHGECRGDGIAPHLPGPHVPPRCGDPHLRHRRPHLWRDRPASHLHTVRSQGRVLRSLPRLVCDCHLLHRRQTAKYDSRLRLWPQRGHFLSPRGAQGVGCYPRYGGWRPGRGGRDAGPESAHHRRNYHHPRSPRYEQEVRGDGNDPHRPHIHAPRLGCSGPGLSQAYRGGRSQPHPCVPPQPPEPGRDDSGEEPRSGQSGGQLDGA
mmetsp:Transcript_518/g.1367  ORF Transcript_518/g.1367 Transcript_518/m.1367 type:complete len:259 (+) Transcript_518:255-1031(+)